MAGRDQRGPMERLVRIAAVLRAAGATGVSGERLADLADFTGDDRIDQVSRELRHLGRQGWQIDNIAATGDSAVYRMTTVDNRLRVRLSGPQQSALRRAALVADRADLADRLGLPADAHVESPADVDDSAQREPDPALGVVVDAVRQGSLLRFRYAGTDRVVHPDSIRTEYRKWYLRGREEGSSLAKAFVVSRMSDVDADEPGTAERIPTERHDGVNPLKWEVDAAVPVRVRTTPTYRLDVHHWLGAPEQESENDQVIELDYLVTHRAALFDRLYELGERVELVGPDDVRDELLNELASMAGDL